MMWYVFITLALHFECAVIFHSVSVGVGLTVMHPWPARSTSSFPGYSRVNFIRLRIIQVAGIGSGQVGIFASTGAKPRLLVATTVFVVVRKFLRYDGCSSRKQLNLIHWDFQENCINNSRKLSLLRRTEKNCVRKILYAVQKYSLAQRV